MKPGFKQTEVGGIPEDWVESAVGTVAIKIGSGITPTGGSNRYKEFGRPFMRSQNVGWGRLLLDDLAFIDNDTHNQFPSTELKQNDVLLNITGASIGRTALADERLVGGNVNQHVCIIRVDAHQARPEFIHLLLLSTLGQRQIDSFQAGGNRQGLNFAQIASIKLALPPTLAEQEAIASALGDADALIESLERLIAKKRDVKQGAMQELLTARRRLPGFTDPWKSKKYSDLLRYERPDKYLVHSDVYTEHGNIPVLTANKSFVLGFTDEDYGVFQSPPVIIFDDFTTDSKYVDFSFKVKSSAIKLLHAKCDEICLRFVSELMRLVKYPIGEHKRYYISEYQHLEMPMPSPSEQTAIITVLSDMDLEIAALEAKLSKARAIKQGMMQELLTGRIRLK